MKIGHYNADLCQGSSKPLFPSSRPTSCLFSLLHYQQAIKLFLSRIRCVRAGKNTLTVQLDFKTALKNPFHINQSFRVNSDFAASAIKINNSNEMSTRQALQVITPPLTTETLDSALIVFLRTKQEVVICFISLRRTARVWWF